MKTILLASILFICQFQNYSYSQSLTIVDFERILKLDLSETNSDLNKFGLSFNNSLEKDSNGCQIITWGRDKCKSTDCLFFINKNFCTNGLYTIIGKCYNASYYYSIKLQLEKNGYKFMDAFTEKNSLFTYYINNEKKRLISLTEERIEGIDGDSDKTLYSITISGK